MSYTNLAPGPGTRPRPVSAAVKLLYLAAACQLAYAALSGFILTRTIPVYQDLYANFPEQGAIRATATVVGVVVIGVSVIAAVAMAVLGVFVGRGKQPARIVTWVVAGLFTLCSLCSAVGTALSSSLTVIRSSPTQPGMPSPGQVTDAVSAALPSWATPTSTTLLLVLGCAFLAVIILLALPASNVYFRKPAEAWVPPTGWPPPGGSVSGWPPPGGSVPPPMPPRGP
jgi:hypothetical protein